MRIMALAHVLVTIPRTGLLIGGPAKGPLGTSTEVPLDSITARALPWAPGTVPECVLAADWVRAHAGALPRTSEEISRYPLAYQRAIYRKLPARSQAGLWREHLESYLGPTTSLSAAQQAVVREALAMLPRAFAEGVSLAERRSLVHTLIPEIDRAFGDKYLRIAVFQRFTTPDPMTVAQAMRASFAPGAADRPSLFTLATWARPEARRGAALGACDCNTGTDYCFTSPPGECTPSVRGCQVEEMGCGPLGSDACDGNCGV